jgi:pyruvate dehydrogenase E2 component (dihydrolipoamide acetyltransferase)
MAVTKVVMPKLSEAMESGKVIKWLKKEGDPVSGGDVIAEIETDKADIELESFGAGVLRKILVPAGERAPVGDLIAVIAGPADDISSLLAGAPVPAAAPSPRPLPRGGEEKGGGRVKASPLARKIAASSGVDLKLLRGSGPGGRIVRRDVEATLATAPTALLAAPGVEFEERPLSAIRAAIARQMVQAKAPVPHFYLTAEIAMDRAWEFREELNGIEGRPKVSITDLVVRASALALVEHPEVNASFQGEKIRVYHWVHIGLAVAIDDGLITAVLRDCNAKPLDRIAIESRDLAERARSRKLKAQELSGATFTVSNLGMFGIDEFSAIINPPEGAILAVGAVREEPVVEQGQIRAGRRMKLTLSCDHRAIDGAQGARFLQTLRLFLEEPLRLLV